MEDVLYVAESSIFEISSPWKRRNNLKSAVHLSRNSCKAHSWADTYEKKKDAPGNSQFEKA